MNLGIEPVPDEMRSPSDFTLLFIRMSSMAAINMGVYYCYTAYHDVTRFFEITVPFRLLTFTIFFTLYLTGKGPRGVAQVAVREALGALWTGYAIHKDTNDAAVG